MSDSRRLEDLLTYPREELDIELKGWLDPSVELDRANIAKAIMAVANHGGGFVIIGIAEIDGRWQSCRAEGIDARSYSQDAVNAIVARYADPPFHVGLSFATHPETGSEHPIVRVPGGHTVPIRARRDDPERHHVRQNRYYTRLPGPRSDEPRNGADWSALINRCVRNQRDELLESITRIMSGSAAPTPAMEVQLAEFANRARARFDELRAMRLANEQPSRYQHGVWTVSYALAPDIERRSLGRFRETLDEVAGNETGWPPWHIFTRAGLVPYAFDDLVECWLAEDVYSADAAHSDFWRASPDGHLYLLRGYQEDTKERIEPGTVLDVALPIWRIGECALHAMRLAQTLGSESTEIHFQVHWDGLAGRRLSRISTGDWDCPPSWQRTCRQDSAESRTTASARDINANLPRVVADLTRPLYNSFEFFSPPEDYVVRQLDEMRGRGR